MGGKRAIDTPIVLQAPFFLIGYCYARIWWFLGHRQSMVTQRALRESDVRRKKRMNKMLVAMVLIFGACWMPMNVFNILRDAGYTMRVPFVQRLGQAARHAACSLYRLQALCHRLPQHAPRRHVG